MFCSFDLSSAIYGKKLEFFIISVHQAELFCRVGGSCIHLSKDPKTKILKTKRKQNTFTTSTSTHHAPPLSGMKGSGTKPAFYQGLLHSTPHPPPIYCAHQKPGVPLSSKPTTALRGHPPCYSTPCDLRPRLCWNPLA